MKLLVCAPLLVSLLLFSGCRDDSNVGEAAPRANPLGIPKWSFLAKITTHFANGVTTLPRSVYVFPAIRLNDQGQAIDNLSYRETAAGGLEWDSPAPLGAELQVIAEKALLKKGFHVISFQTLTRTAKDHDSLVINLYYMDARAGDANVTADPEGNWTGFVNVKAATFPKDLSPQGKRDLMSQELVALYDGRQKADGVSKRAVTYLLENIGRNGGWDATINMLE